MKKLFFLVFLAACDPHACDLPPPPPEPNCTKACRDYARTHHVSVAFGYQYAAGNICACILDDDTKRLTCDPGAGECP